MARVGDTGRMRRWLIVLVVAGWARGAGATEWKPFSGPGFRVELPGPAQVASDRVFTRTPDGSFGCIVAWGNIEGDYQRAFEAFQLTVAGYGRRRVSDAHDLAIDGRPARDFIVAWPDVKQFARIIFDAPSRVFTIVGVVENGANPDEGQKVVERCRSSFRLTAGKKAEAPMNRPSPEVVAHTGIVRRPGFIYYLVGCDVFERRPKQPNGEPAGPPTKVASAKFPREARYSYFIDRAGNIARLKWENTLADTEGLRRANPHHADDPEFGAFLETLKNVNSR